MATNPWSNINVTADDQKDALHEVSRMLVGTKMLQDEPGVVYSLAAQQAHPQDAQAVDQFMQSLDAEKQVNLARAAGETIHLTDNQQTMLKANNVNYSDVLWTQKGAADTAAQQLQAKTNGDYTAKVNPDGSLALDANGQIQPVKTHHDQAHSGWFSSPGSFFGHLGGAVKTGFSDTLEGVSKAYNFVATPLAQGLQEGIHDIGYDVTHGTFTGDAQYRINLADSRDQEMRAAGYDSSSIFSNLAYNASGKAHTDLTKLNEQYGSDKVTEALTFLDNPDAYKKSIETDSNNYFKDANGQTHMTPDGLAKLKYLNSDEFTTLAKKVNAQHATVGNELANALGIDPVHHSTTYALTAAGANIAASFVIDPTMLALQGVKVAKLATVGLDTLGDSDKAASILTANSKLPWINNVQRGWQQAIDLAGQMRAAHAANDTTALAGLTAKFNAELPGIAPLMGEFIGEHAVTGWEEAVVNGKKTMVPTMGNTGGIKSMEDAADFVKSKHGLNLLMNGRAATQSSLMPGALSAVGYRKLKGATAAWMSERSASRATAAYKDVISRAEADPMLAAKLLDDGTLIRLAPEADDAVTMDGAVLAQPGSTGLASAVRGSRYGLTAAGAGDVVRNLRKTGDALGDSVVGWASPAAIAARSRLAAQRLSTLLPRNTVIDVNDAGTGDKLYKYALTYLNRGDAQSLRAAWNFGDAGQRKAIVSGLVDQVGHAAGLGKSTAGQDILNRAKTASESYSAAGSEIELDGQRLALFEGQTRDKWTLPTFQALQQASSKIGLWETTLGRPMTASQSDSLMAQWKMGALFKPSTFTRNWLEGNLRAALDGKLGAAVKARAVLTAKNKELWDRGYALDTPLKAEYDAAVAGGDFVKAKQIERGSMLSGDLLGRSTVMTKLTDVGPLAITGRAYRALVGKTMGNDDIEALLTLGHEDLAEAMEGYGQQILASDLGYKHAANEATSIATAGYGPAKLRFAVRRALSRSTGKAPGADGEGATNWTHQALDGTVGADRYATALAQRINGMPKTAKAAIEYIESRISGGASPLPLQHVVDAMDSEKRLTSFGKVFFEDPNGAPNIARRAVTEDESLTGKQLWAQKVVDEHLHLMSGQNGVFQKDLASYVKVHGEAPDGNWIADHLTADNRPESALAPEVIAMPNGGLKSLPTTLQDIEGGAYQWMVERMLQRTTSSPVFMANYAIARKGLNRQVEQLVEQGFSREAANNFAKDLSIRQSWVKTEQIIDDPGQKAQFDVLARNMIPFSRATQAMIRRWGTGLWQNPAAARKMMLAYEGAEHSGLIYDNAYGEPTFTYPGSGAMNLMMRALSKVPGFENVAAFPVASDMTGGVLMSVPGAENPLRMGMGPMISIPFREVYKHWLPTAWRGQMEDLDTFINGPVGTGETVSQLVPTIVRKFYVGMVDSDRNSALASSMNGAFANLAAAGLIPAPDASPAELQAFRGRLQTQVRSQLFLRAVFGIFAPAAPSAPSEGSPASGADYAWQLDGLKQLSDEYKSVLNDVGGDVGRANAIFTAMHPDQVAYKTDGTEETKLPSSAYETAKSAANASGAYLPSTKSALTWLEKNDSFVKKYGSVAAYFLPTGSTGEPFSDAAYKASIEFGLRIKKTPQQFMDDVYVKHAEQTFFPTVDAYDLKINQAKAANDTATVNALTVAKSQWEKEYKAINPLLGAKMGDYGTARAKALGQIADLRDALKAGAIPDGLAPKLRAMLATYDKYEAYIGAHAGADDANTAARASALDTVNRWADQELAKTPLADLFNGVFRVLNTNFQRLDGAVQ